MIEWDQTDHDGGLSAEIGVPGGDSQTHLRTLLPERQLSELRAVSRAIIEAPQQAPATSSTWRAWGKLGAGATRQFLIASLDDRIKIIRGRTQFGRIARDSR
jgi:hypothetical protein